MSPSPGRRVAVEVLHRVAEDGAWAMPTLDAEIRRARLDARDAGLATEIVYGALRVLPALDEVLARFLKQPRKTDPYLRAALRASAYQLLHLDRAPPHAVVSDAVAIVKQGRSPRLGGVANAVLRKVAKERAERPERPSRIVLPLWLEQRLRGALGKERGEAFLSDRPLPPPLGLRAFSDRDVLLEVLRGARPDGSFEAVGEVGIAVHGAGDVRTLPGFADGHFCVQELGAQAVTEWVGASEGERLADLCCGHGTKTLAFARAVGRSGRVEAADLHEAKLDALEAERVRLGIPSAQVGTRAVDLTVGLGGLEPQSFDRVVLDAPCTGLGTVHRRPELALRVGPGDPTRLARLQEALLEAAVQLVKPGGELVYVVCSPMFEEGPAVVAAFASKHPSVEPAETASFGPWEGDRDAYYGARWRIR